MRIALQSADFATDLSLVRSAQKAVLFVGFAVALRPLWLQIPSSKKRQGKNLVAFLVGVTGFEPTTSWSRTMRATICATPRKQTLSLAYKIILDKSGFVKRFTVLFYF